MLPVAARANGRAGRGQKVWRSLVLAGMRAASQGGSGHCVPRAGRPAAPRIAQVQQLQEQYADAVARNTATSLKAQEAVQELAAATGTSAAVVEQMLRTAKQQATTGAGAGAKGSPSSKAGAGGKPGGGSQQQQQQQGGSPKAAMVLVGTGRASSGGLLTRADGQQAGAQSPAPRAVRPGAR
jgi:hypothetical protein